MNRCNANGISNDPAWVCMRASKARAKSTRMQVGMVNERTKSICNEEPTLGIAKAKADASVCGT